MYPLERISLPGLLAVKTLNGGPSTMLRSLLVLWQRLRCFSIGSELAIPIGMSA